MVLKIPPSHPVTRFLFLSLSFHWALCGELLLLLLLLLLESQVVLTIEPRKTPEEEEADLFLLS